MAGSYGVPAHDIGALAAPQYYSPQIQALQGGAPLFQPPMMGVAAPTVAPMGNLHTVPSMVTYPFHFSAVAPATENGTDSSEHGASTDPTAPGATSKESKESSSKKLTAKKKSKGCC
eukprot:UN4146